MQRHHGLIKAPGLKAALRKRPEKKVQLLKRPNVVKNRVRMVLTAHGRHRAYRT